MFAFVLGLSFILLLIVFHSIVIPIKAILLNLLSTAAAYGVVVAVFQDDILGGRLGIASSSVIESWVPIFIFTILFGLSMDYHVFILTRVKEARDRGLDSRAAVARGIALTAGTITSAATIMVVVFLAFVTIPFAFIQELGLGLAVAVLIDATIVRSRAAAGDDGGPGRLELVPAGLPRLDPEGHDRGRAGARRRGLTGSGARVPSRARASRPRVDRRARRSMTIPSPGPYTLRS